MLAYLGLNEKKADSSLAVELEGVNLGATGEICIIQLISSQNPTHIVVYVRGCTPLKIFFRLRLQNLFPSVHPRTVADGRWRAVVLCCVCLRVEVMVSMSARCSKVGGYGFKCIVHVSGWRAWFQYQRVVLRVEAMVSTFEENLKSQYL